MHHDFEHGLQKRETWICYEFSVQSISLFYSMAKIPKEPQCAEDAYDRVRAYCVHL